MARKKKTNEQEQFDVELSGDEPGGQAEKVVKTVSASSKQDAMRKATVGDPHARGYEQVSVTGKGPAKPEPAKPADVAETKGKKAKGRKAKPKIDPETMEMVESASYPYSIMLPGGFAPFLSKMLGESLPIRNGKVHARIEDSTSMVKLMASLTRSRERHAKVIREGIRESLR